MAQHDYTEHHIKPQSRGGQKTTELPKEFHQAWHVVMSNLTPKEIRLFIEDILILMEQKDKIKSKEIHEIRENIKGLFEE